MNKITMYNIDYAVTTPSLLIIKATTTLVLNIGNFGIFSAREAAIEIWIAIGIIAMLFYSKLRKTIFVFLKLLIDRYFICTYISVFMYARAIVFLLYKIGFWEWDFLKDTIF